MSTPTDEKGGTTSCATSCADCGAAEMLFPTDDERRIDALRAEVATLKREAALFRLLTRLDSGSREDGWELQRAFPEDVKALRAAVPEFAVLHDNEVAAFYTEWGEEELSAAWFSMAYGVPGEFLAWIRKSLEGRP